MDSRQHPAGCKTDCSIWQARWPLKERRRHRYVAWRTRSNTVTASGAAILNIRTNNVLQRVCGGGGGGDDLRVKRGAGRAPRRRSFPNGTDGALRGCCALTLFPAAALES